MVKCVVCSKIASQWKWKPYHLANWQQSSDWNPGLTITQCSLPYTLHILLLLLCNQRLVLFVSFTPFILSTAHTTLNYGSPTENFLCYLQVFGHAVLFFWNSILAVPNSFSPLGQMSS